MLLQSRPKSALGKLRELLEDPVAPSASRPFAADRAACAADVVSWVDTWCRTYDPREEGKSIPFKLWPKQAEFLRWLRERELAREDGLCEKSRDAGISFLCAAYALHGWLFRPGWKCGFGSRKLELVDSLGDRDSIFEKIRFMMRGLPEWQLPRGFRFGVHDCHTRIVNPETGSTITGEGGDQIGRGGRNSMYFVDEAAHIPRPHLIDQAMVANTNVRIDVSTPNGSGNPFYRKRFSGLVNVFTFRWTDDPRKNEQWKRETIAKKGSTVFAIEYGLDYSASLEGICIPGDWVQAAVDLVLPGWTDDPEGKGQRWAGLDIGEEGNDLSVFIPRRGPVVAMPESWQGLLTTQTAWKARDLAAAWKADALYFDADGVGTGVKGTLRSAETPLPFRVEPIHAGGSPTDNRWPDGKTSGEKFLNLKAELWWRLRCRFERTFEHVSKVAEHPTDELISLPDHQGLIGELSQVQREFTDRGKIKIESKDALQRRGIKSPDFADALVLTEAAYAVKKKKLNIW